MPESNLCDVQGQVLFALYLSISLFIWPFRGSPLSIYLFCFFMMTIFSDFNIFLITCINLVGSFYSFSLQYMGTFGPLLCVKNNYQCFYCRFFIFSLSFC